MIQAGEYSDALRAVGRFLDKVGATGIEVREQEDCWATTWERGGGSQFGAFQIEALRTAARSYRGLEGDVPQFNTSQILRALGRTLDTVGGSRFLIKEVSEGFQLSARVGGNRIGQTYSLDEVRTLVDTQLGARAAA